MYLLHTALESDPEDTKHPKKMYLGATLKNPKDSKDHHEDL